MPAIGSRATDAGSRSLRLVALAVALLFLASAGAAWATPAEGKDWTPQIKSTRRAQIYWETIMRSADAELRSLKKTQKQAQRKLKKIEGRRDKVAAKRRAAKRKLNAAKVELAESRQPAAAPPGEVPPGTVPEPPRAEAALEELLAPAGITTLAPATVTLDSAMTLEEVSPATPPSAVVDDRETKRLERAAKQAKRDFKKAKRKTRRSARNAQAAKRRVASLKSAERAAKSRRQSAERNLGAWILAMTKYGRIRATKKSPARPGVTTRFDWPVRGRISQRYHAGHDGLDIVRYKGAAVRSMAFGVVTYVGWNPWDQHGRAFMVVVTHAGGHETLYGHLLPRRIVRVGEEVKKGQVIGYMGSTGNSTGPHLHLELRRGRTTLNPLRFL